MRLPYPRPEDHPEPLKEVPPLNLFRAFGNAPAYTGGLIDLGLVGLGKLVLTPRQRELLILDTATSTGSAYVTQAHVPFGQAVGITGEQASFIRQREPLPGPFLPEEAALLAVGRELLQSATCTGEAIQRAHLLCGARAVTETLILVGYYRLVCGFANALDVEPDGKSTHMLPYAS
ncbi:carboxymuconolactone decarboxylase family protein [Streptomyces sp. GS7]|uniref:carboxymuconolactone decarboxylase family protein n=1 Tax=Streptomyces sp. GS7 TaxID=2692234 RepID=UPI001315D817|nr:carboxymuconolactone decarboxylase family protein [Streptomyces sp. GS7]QHC23589.1 hypothetical protein GR130_21650 [Streptomyces sp. GS7]